MKNYTVTSGQSLFDIAVLVYGNVTGITWLIQDNKLNGPTDRVYEGQQLLIRAEAISVRTKAYLTDHPVIATIAPIDMPDGVSWWRLDEYVVGGDVDVVEPEPVTGLAFVPGTLSYGTQIVTGESCRVISFAINETGRYTLIFRAVSTGQIYNSYVVDFHAGEIQQFGFFIYPATYQIEILDIHTQISIR